MEIENTRFGTIQVDDEKIITMPAGMPGFPGKKRFVILEREETRPFYWYQSVDEPDLSFVIINPYLFKPDYAVDLKRVLKEMSWEGDDPESIKLYAVVNAGTGDPEKITANLMGPLIINIQVSEAVQKVFHDSTYPTRYPILAETRNISVR